MRCKSVVVVVVAFVLSSLLIGAPSQVLPSAASHGPGVRPDFSDWHVGDVHVHAAGDSTLDENKRCDKANKLPWGQREADKCAKYLIDLMYDRAEANGAEWLVFTEHGNWLGYDRGGYNHAQAVKFLGMLEVEAEAASRKRRTLAGLIGQELGTSAPAPCSPPRGHFGVYYAPTVVRNGLTECNEVNFMTQTEVTGGWGAVNHPESGSNWNCWYTGDDILGPENCEEGAVDFAEGRSDIVETPRHDRIVSALEAVTSNDLPTGDLEDQWDRMLQDGYRVGATGGADAHTVNKDVINIAIGGGEGNHGKVALNARTYAYVDGSIRPDGGFRSNDPSHPVRRALRNGRTIASNGPLLVPQVNGNFPDDGGVAGPDPTFTGDTVNVRVDWPRTRFRTLRSGANQANPDPEDRISFEHAPEVLDVVVGRVQGSNTCEGAPRQPCETGIVRRTHQVTDAERAAGYAVVPVPVESTWDNIYTRVFGRQTDTYDEKSYEFGALSSPIYLERGSTAGTASDPNCQASSLAGNDDLSTGRVQLPFPVNFFGTAYESLFVNNNGNVTFNSAMGTYTPFEITATTPPIIAPFFADVDTRAAGSKLVTYGTTTYEGRQAFCVYWDDVGYYANHADKLNSFRLYLVDRSDAVVGDFDIVFDYRRLLWETGDASGGQNGFGGRSAGAGFSSGTGSPEGFFQIPGTLVNGAFLDGGPNSLVAGSRDSGGQPGIWRFRVRSGLSPGVHSLSGRVVAGASGGQGVEQALVQVCTLDQAPSCTLVRTDADGDFVASGLPAGTYALRGMPPVGASELAPGTATSGPVGPGSTPFVEIVLPTTTGTPPGTTLSPSRAGANGVPTVYTGQATELTTEACPGGSVTVSVTRNGETIAGPLPMDETRPGVFTAALPPFSGSGTAEIVITVTCTDGSVRVSTFTVYIDPSGRVVDQAGQPIRNAVVTLLRSDNPEGPFEAVADGSPIMSPSNRANPDSTDDAGRFAWDVVAGYYRVRAEAFGCAAPDRSTAYVETPVLTIPPPALDLELVLDCTPPSEGALVLEAAVARVDGGGAPSGSAAFTVTCADGALDLGRVVANLDEEVRLAPVPVGSTCIVSLDEAPAGWRLMSPGTAQVEILPHVDTYSEFVGVMGTVPDSLAVSVISTDDAPATGTVEADVRCEGGHQERIAMGVDGDGVLVEGPVLGDVCVVTVVAAPGLAVDPPSRTVTIRPSATDDTWFVARPARTSIDDVVLREGDAGHEVAEFTVSLSEPAGPSGVVVTLSTADGTAQAPSDYEPRQGVMVRFEPGETTKPFPVRVVGDRLDEGDETFAVNIESSTAGISDGQGLGVIVEDERNGAFTCRGSGVRLGGSEAAVANPPGRPCADGTAPSTSGTLTSGLVRVSTSTAEATTDMAPNLPDLVAPATTDRAAAQASVQRASVTVAGLLSITVTGAHAEAELRCDASPDGLVPRLEGSSTTASITINGVAVDVGSASTVKLPSGLGTLTVDRTLSSPTTLTRQAVRIQVLGLEVVLGEARAGFSGNPCRE